MTSATPEMLDPGQAAAFLGVTRELLRDWRHKGEGPPYFRLGHRTVRYGKPDLERFRQAHRVSPGAAR